MAGNNQNKGGIYMMLPIAVECSHCDAGYDLSYSLDLSKAQRNRQVFKQDWIRKVYREVRSIIEDDGWMVSGTTVYCPDCASRFDSGELTPDVSMGNARDLVHDFSMLVKSSRAKRRNEKED